MNDPWLLFQIAVAETFESARRRGIGHTTALIAALTHTIQLFSMLANPASSRWLHLLRISAASLGWSEVTIGEIFALPHRGKEYRQFVKELRNLFRSPFPLA